LCWSLSVVALPGVLSRCDGRMLEVNGMAGIRVVTDSTADLPLDLAAKRGVSVVPLNVHFDTGVYKDQIELTSEQFFKKLVTDPSRPRTSQPSPGDFATEYRRLVDQGNAVVSIHLSAKLSGTYQSAMIAREGFPDARIEVMDTGLASTALGLIVLEAAEAAARGADFGEVVEVVRRAQQRSGVIFVVDTLDYLFRNGRLGRAQHLMGSLLNMKPILTLEDGTVAALDKVRGKNKALGRMYEIVRERVPKGAGVKMAVAHGAAPDVAQIVADRLARDFGPSELIIAPLGAVIATHAGPGTIAVCYLMT